MFIVKFKDLDKIHFFNNQQDANSFLKLNSDKVLDAVPINKIKDFESFVNRKDVIFYNNMFYKSFNFEPNIRVV